MGRYWVHAASNSVVGRPSPTQRVLRWRIGERPSDMGVSCESNKQSRTIWRCTYQDGAG